MESYIVRIYRRESRRKGDIRAPVIVGLVESVHDDAQRAFHSAEQLWSILLEERVRAPRRARQRNTRRR